MSYKVENSCSDRLFGGPVRKQIIMFLANKASDDGSGVFCSKGTIARHTELGGSTVKRVISEFVAEGILVETGSRPCANGYTVIYRIDIDKVEMLEPIKNDFSPTPSRLDRVRSGLGTGSRADGVPRPQRDPNHPNLKPPTRKREAEEAAVAGEILKAYPPDRLRGEAACVKQIEQAIDEGIASEDLLQATQAYASTSSGFTRSKVCYSDNWFQSRRWLPYLETFAEDRERANASAADHDSRLAPWINKKHPMCKYITPTQVTALLASKLVTAAQVVSVGLTP